MADIDRPVPEQDDEGLRDEAERHLRALAGDHARLRDDQWTAISALVADRRRALVVQRTGGGKAGPGSTRARSTPPTPKSGTRSTRRSRTARPTCCWSAPNA